MRKWLRVHDESEWSLQTTLIFRFLSTVSRTRRSFLEASAPVVMSLIGTNCCSNQQNVNVFTSHDGSLGHSVSGRELSEV